MSRFLPTFNKMSPWHFLWIDVIVAELLTILTSLMASNLLWGRLSREVVIIGIIDAAVVSVPLAFFTIFFVSRIQRARAINDQLLREIEQRKILEAERERLLVELGQKHKMESIGTLATGIAHEINQPLSYIKVVFEVMLRDLREGMCDLAELEQDGQESLQQIKRITTVINHLRTFGHGDALSFDTVDLREVLDNSLILMANAMNRKNIEFKADIEENLPLVYGNGVKLQQVFINMLQNSVDALDGSPAGRIIVAMRSDSEQVAIEFIDNGDGIADQSRDKIFEPFYTTRGVGKGTGLGLSIVYGIAQEHKGRIEYMPDRKGTTFRLTLPIAGPDALCEREAPKGIGAALLSEPT